MITTAEFSCAAARRPCATVLPVARRDRRSL